MTSALREGQRAVGLEREKAIIIIEGSGRIFIKETEFEILRTNLILMNEGLSCYKLM